MALDTNHDGSTDISEIKLPDSLANSPTMVNTSSLLKWILAICVVNFDLDEGPVIESIYPSVEFEEYEMKTM